MTQTVVAAVGTLVAPLLCVCLSVVLYSRGFLLNRQELHNHTTCTQHVDCSRLSNLRSFDRAVFLVVDAFRYDFVAPQNGSKELFHNTQTVIHSLLETSPRHAALFRFVADPPTTTLQRLKALTTGSLPTFVDASSNFAGYEVQEDSWLWQVTQARRTVTLFGDDTWTALYAPYLSANSVPMPSFDVHDLDTVDTAVQRHIYKAVNESTGVVVGHLLGVDHAGHRYGTAHAEMRRKLLFVNQLIGNLTSHLPSDTLLVVLGDHGMTSTGDHGGDSPDEVDAALFVFAKERKLRRGSLEESVMEAVSQVDLVPSMSLLIGLPIPFSNLGCVIPSLFESEDDGDFANDAILINAHQIVQYVNEYLAVSKDSELQRELRPLLQDVAIESNAGSSDAVRAALVQIRAVFHRHWVQFNLALMVVAVALMACSLTYLLSDSHSPHVWVVHIVISVAVFFCKNYDVILWVFTASIACYTVYRLIVHLRASSVDSTAFVHTTLVLLASISSFSNSYVVNGQMCSHFLLLGSVTFICCSIHPSPLRSLRQSASLLVSASLFRAGFAFTRCRDEHGPSCTNSPFSLPLSSIPHADRLPRVFLGITCLFLAVVLLLRYFRQNYVLLPTDRSILNVIVLPYGLFFVCICYAYHWSACAFMTPEFLLKHNLSVRLAPLWTVYALCAVLVYCLARRPQVFERLVSSCQSSSPYLLLLALECAFLSAPLEDGLSASLLMQCFAVVLLSNACNLTETTAPVILFLHCRSMFYALGHQTAFNTLPWNAAFAGVSGGTTVLQPLHALLVLSHVFASHIVCPLLLAIAVFPHSLLSVLRRYTTFHAVQLLFTVIASLLLRRHLMVWKIFAPSLIFEAVGFFVTCVNVTFVYGASLWITGSAKEPPSTVPQKL